MSPILGGGSRESISDTSSSKKAVSWNLPSSDETRYSCEHKVSDEKPLKLPLLPTFDGANRDDIDALGRWLTKLAKHAELLRWSDHTKLLQFELHLAGRAERVYELLPTSKRSNFDEATQALSERLYPIESEALVSGLLLRWQKKVLPSASTYSDALHQARAAEQQERQLLKLHPTMKPFSKSKPMTEPKIADPVPADPKVEQPKATHPRQRGGPPKCYECGSTSHKWRECSLRKPTETPGKVPTASSLAITTHSESIDERCQRLQQEWVDVEFARMTSAYETTASVDQIARAVGSLCYATVEITGENVKAMVDTGSSATVLSFELFSKIGKNAKIPATTLSKPDVVLRDYNRRRIPVGAKVDLTFRYCGKSVVAPVYIRAGGHDESETCLLGTNIIFALGLMEPA